VLNIVVPVFDLGRSNGNVRSGRSPTICIQNCV